MNIIAFIIRWWKPIVGGLALIAMTILPSFFNKPKEVSIRDGGTYVEASEGYEPMFGCATGRQYWGWAKRK